MSTDKVALQRRKQSVCIERFKSHHAKAIAQMIASGSKEGAFRSGLSPTAKETVEWFRNIEGGLIFVALSESKAAGYCNLIVSPGGVLEVDGIYVSKNLRGRGIGSSLVRRALQASRRLKCHKITCKTYASKKKSVAFWLSHQFNKEALLIDDEFRKDVLILSRFLSEERYGTKTKRSESI
jgi:GNAT superfamily N-acetyltransferase